MTSIAATSAASYQSPLQKLQAELQSEVSNGAVSSTDQGALSSALTDIDSSLQSQSAPDTGGTQSSPDDLKSKIDTLIAGEVSSGKLTSDQAAELQKVFSNTFASGGPGGPDAAAGGAGGAHRAGGHHHGGHGGAKGAGGASSSADGTDSSSSTTSASDLLQQFLQSLQDSQSSASSTGYDANGDGSSTTSASSALLIDYQS